MSNQKQNTQTQNRTQQQELVGVRTPTQQVQPQAEPKKKSSGWKTTAKWVGGAAVVGAVAYVGYRCLRSDDSQELLPDLGDVVNVDAPGYIA